MPSSTSISYSNDQAFLVQYASEMPPISMPLPVRLSEVPTDTTNLDLSLITYAVAISIILSYIPDAKNILHPWRTYRAWLILIISLLTFVGALFLLVFTLAIGWRQRISIDALTAVMFAMAPALGRIPVVYETMLLVGEILHRPSLCIRTDRFRIAKYFNDKTCGAHPNSVFWEKEFDSCNGKNCNVGFFVYILPQKDYEGTLSRVYRSLKNPFPFEEGNQFSPRYTVRIFQYLQLLLSTLLSSSEEKQQDESRETIDNGTIIGHSRNFIIIRENRASVWKWWWESLSSSTYLALDPTKFMLVDQYRVLNAFELISDISSIGRIVIWVRRYYITKLWEQDYEVEKWKTSSTGLTCIKIMEQLGLPVWYDYNAKDMKSTFIRSADGQYVKRRRQCGILFCILTGTSSLFAEMPPDLRERKGRKTNPWYFRRRIRRISGQEVLDDIMNSGNLPEQEFEKLCREKVDEWLIDWGCKPSSLKDEDNIRRELGIQKRNGRDMMERGSYELANQNICLVEPQSCTERAEELSRHIAEQVKQPCAVFPCFHQTKNHHFGAAIF